VPDPVRPTEVDDHVAVLDPLDGAVHDLADAVLEFLVLALALGVADLLDDDLLGVLGGDAAEFQRRKRFGELVAAEFKRLSPEYNNGKKINVIYQKLSYMTRGGDPDAIDSIVPMAYGNLALDLILEGIHGRLVVLKNGRYDNMPIDVVTSSKKVVDVKRHYNVDRLRPHYKSFEMKPLFIMTSELE